MSDFSSAIFTTDMTQYIHPKSGPFRPIRHPEALGPHSALICIIDIDF